MAVRDVRRAWFELLACGSKSFLAICGISKWITSGLPSFEANLFGTIVVTKAALPYFRQGRAGHFVQFSSMGGRIGPPGRGPYSAAKWGVEGFSEVLSRELAPLGIKSPSLSRVASARTSPAVPPN